MKNWGSCFFRAPFCPDETGFPPDSRVDDLASMMWIWLVWFADRAVKRVRG